MLFAAGSVVGAAGFTVGDLVASLTLWICKKTIQSAYYWWRPPPPQIAAGSQSTILTRDEIRQMRRALHELKILQEQRRERERRGATTRDIDELANSIVFEAVGGDFYEHET